MIKCIFTNIKNEHRYLDEWIKYHIKIGFNKFILYEDEGSRSHDNIISKYNDIVDIDLYNYILGNDNPEFKDLTCFKHIWENYTDIDWLIKLDPDEYIAFNSGINTIDDYIYSLPSEVEQTLIPWRIYNANGYIHSPSEGVYNLNDTYISYIKNDDMDHSFDINTSTNGYLLSKAFIRYKSFKKDFLTELNESNLSFAFPHQIFENCNTLVENTIFIKHFITKSFEEFLYRLKEKGEYLKGFERKLGDFFVMNPDMQKDISLIEKEFGINIADIKTKLNK